MIARMVEPNVYAVGGPGYLAGTRFRRCLSGLNLYTGKWT
jgi:hypothetical protein